MRLFIFIFTASFFLLMVTASHARPADPRLKYYSARRGVICEHNESGICVKNQAVKAKEKESRRKIKLRPWL